MNRYIALVIERPKTFLSLLFLVTILLLTGIPKLRFDNSVEAFLPKDDDEYVFYNQTKDIYGDNGRFFIMSVGADDLWSRNAFSKIDSLVSDLEEYKDYDEALEKKRLTAFDRLMRSGPVSKKDLLSSFSSDPGFQRLLARKIDKYLKGKEQFRPKDLAALRKRLVATKELKAGEMVDKIISPFTSKDITGANDTLDTYDLIPKDENGKRILPETPADFQAFRERLERNPAFEKGIYSRDPDSGEIADMGIILKFKNLKNQDTIARELLNLIESHTEIDIMPQGSPVINIWFNDYLKRDLRTFLPFTLAVVILIFFFNFRSFRGVILPSITLGMTTIWILGLMGYAGIKITALGVSLPPLMIAVGSSYSIHILNQYYADFALITREGRKSGLTIAMSHISTTVLLAALTTFVAFSTLATSQLSAIREWGIFSGIGVLFAVFISSTLIPAGLTLLPHKMPRLLMKKNDQVKTTLIDRIIALMTAGATRHHRAVLTVLICLILVSLAGLTRLNVESEFLQYFKEDDIVRTSAKIIEEKFGGRWGFNILIDSGEMDGVKDPKLLNAVEEIRGWLASDENRHLNIGRTDSFADTIKTMHFAMNGDNPDYYRIPKTRMDIMDYLEIYSGDDDNSDGRFDDFESFVDPNYQVCNLLARFCQKEDYALGTTETKRIIEEVDRHVKNMLPAEYSSRISGFPIMNIKIAEYIISGQLQSLALSLVVIAIIVSLLFTMVKAGILSLIPMSVAVIINFGIMGWAGINLDTVTSIIAAITIGIGVDDTIHFLNTFRYNRKLGYDVDETIRLTLAVSGKAIIFTSLALILGFSVMTISSFQPVILFGLLMAITMIATTIGALLVLPCVIKAIGGLGLDKQAVGSGLWRYVNLGKVFGLEQEVQNQTAKKLSQKRKNSKNSSKNTGRGHNEVEVVDGSGAGAAGCSSSGLGTDR